MSPSDFVLRIALHLPFLSGFAALERRDADVPAPRALTFDVDAAAQVDDLILQGYSDQLRADFQRHLPHRVLRFEEPAQLRADPVGTPVVEGSAIGWSLRTLDVDVWSSGVALVTATYLLAVPGAMSWAAVGADVEAARHVLDDRLAPLRAAALAGVRAAADSGRLRVWRLPDTNAGDPDPHALWTHVTFLAQARRTADRAGLGAVADRLTRGGAAPEPVAELRGLGLRIGLDTAIAYEPVDAPIAASVARMSGVHTAVWASAVDLDRRLLRLRTAGSQPSLRGIERRLEETVELFDHARALRGELDTVAVHLSALDRALWTAYAATWGLSTQLESIDVKLAAHEHVLTHTGTAIANRRAQALNALALPFTVASVVGVVGGLVDLSSKRLEVPAGANLWLVGGLVALAIALWLLFTGVVLRSAERARTGRRLP